MRGHRRAFTPEFRFQAAHMVIDCRRRVPEVASELGVHQNLLYTWVRDERWRMAEGRSTAAQTMDSEGAQWLSARERAELVRLRTTVTEQAEEIAILKKVSAYFAAAALKAGRLQPVAAECASYEATRTAGLPGASISPNTSPSGLEPSAALYG